MKNLIFFLLLIFSLNSFAENCSVYLIDVNSDLEKIQKILDKDNILSSSQRKLLEDQNEDIRRFLVETISNYEYSQFSDALKLLKESPEVFERLGKFDPNRFIVEVIYPGYTKNSYKRLQDFQPSLNKHTWEVPPFKEGVNPTDEDVLYREALDQTKKLFDDEQIVFTRMQEFEDEIIVRSRASVPNFDELPKKEQAILKQNKMIEIMSELEIKHGFKSTSDDGYEALVLANKSYGLDEWLEMLADGKMFNDSAFKSVDNPLDITNRGGHGYFTHRIQFYVLMKEIDANPSKYGDLNASQLFKKLGDKEFNQKVGAANNGGDTLWQQMFDAFSGSYHQPETFRKMHGLYPELGAWL
jgi:hypothetical protein